MNHHVRIDATQRLCFSLDGDAVIVTHEYRTPSGDWRSEWERGLAFPADLTSEIIEAVQAMGERYLA